MHGGDDGSNPSLRNDLKILERGCDNFTRHIHTTVNFGVNVIVAVNRFTGDREEEIELIKNIAKSNGCFDAVAANHFC